MEHSRGSAVYGASRWSSGAVQNRRILRNSETPSLAAYVGIRTRRGVASVRIYILISPYTFIIIIRIIINRILTPRYSRSPSRPTTNLLADACRTPHGIATDPLKFPNLVTGFDRNPTHAARAALYTRYTPCDWLRNQIKLYNEANTCRNYSENLRKNVLCSMR